MGMDSTNLEEETLAYGDNGYEQSVKRKEDIVGQHRVHSSRMSRLIFFLQNLETIHLYRQVDVIAWCCGGSKFIT